jgi:hypothetical protein
MSTFASWRLSGVTEMQIMGLAVVEEGLKIEDGD